MRIGDILSVKRPVFSVEFLPPKTDEGRVQLFDTARQLAELDLDFVSVTYGAGGSNREGTIDITTTLKDEVGLEAMAHLSCVGETAEGIDRTLDRLRDAGIDNILALRGDPPEGIGKPFTPHPEGYQNAAELVAGIRKIGDFDISVAAYPEKHPQSPDWASDIDNLKRKLEAGATRAITQMFFDNNDYFRLVDRARKAGITAPIVPGIQPIHSFKQISGFAARCGATIPDWVAQRFEGLDEDPETHALVASAVAAEQVLELVDHGITEFHFYTLNRSNFVLALARLLGVRPN